MTSPETSNTTTLRPKHSSATEAQVRNLKTNIMKMIQVLKEKMKRTFREIEGNTNKIGGKQ